MMKSKYFINNRGMNKIIKNTQRIFNNTKKTIQGTTKENVSDPFNKGINNIKGKYFQYNPFENRIRDDSGKKIPPLQNYNRAIKNPQEFINNGTGHGFLKGGIIGTGIGALSGLFGDDGIIDGGLEGAGIGAGLGALTGNTLVKRKLVNYNSLKERHSENRKKVLMKKMNKIRE